MFSQKTIGKSLFGYKLDRDSDGRLFLLIIKSSSFLLVRAYSFLAIMYHSGQPYQGDDITLHFRHKNEALI